MQNAANLTDKGCRTLREYKLRISGNFLIINVVEHVVQTRSGFTILECSAEFWKQDVRRIIKRTESLLQSTTGVWPDHGPDEKHVVVRWSTVLTYCTVLGSQSPPMYKVLHAIRMSSIPLQVFWLNTDLILQHLGLPLKNVLISIIGNYKIHNINKKQHGS